MAIGDEALDQLTRSGLVSHLRDITCDDRCVRAVADLKILDALRRDDRFKEGIFHLLHDEHDVPGEFFDRTEFRSHRKMFGRGSLQVVVNFKTGEMYADIDDWSAYEDVVGIVGHLVFEVGRNKLRKIVAAIRHKFSGT